ncbi:hypothetical protein [Streptomyces sp. GMY02]|uniref:hypothetical protein n=1 Tax=Streptomyces sp. GMY02 TaxID=1333528 RepID=UPI001F15A86C|nr:hypothetical protein [Streptomyces sp. GMY02]
MLLYSAPLPLLLPPGAGPLPGRRLAAIVVVLLAAPARCPVLLSGESGRLDTTRTAVNMVFNGVMDRYATCA